MSASIATLFNEFVDMLTQEEFNALSADAQAHIVHIQQLTYNPNQGEVNSNDKTYPQAI